MLPLYLGEMLQSGKVPGHLSSASSLLILKQDLHDRCAHSVTTETQKRERKPNQHTVRTPHLTAQIWPSLSHLNIIFLLCHGAHKKTNMKLSIAPSVRLSLRCPLLWFTSKINSPFLGNSDPRDIRGWP